jgi:Fe-S cluster assembly protein SufB
VLFLSAITACKEHEELFKQYFGTVIPSTDNKFAALNSAVWSGGSFIYVPKGVHVDVPLQAYFRINTKDMGQFERTLIIVDEGAYVHYVEGLHGADYSSDSLHSAVVEIIVKPGARCRYTTIQNWSNNVYNLVTKRAVAYRDATMEWVDGNLGSKITQKYPSVYMMEPGATARSSRSRSRQGAASGRGRQGDSLRAEHQQQDHLEVHQQGRRTRRLSRAGQGAEGRGGLAQHRELRRADPRRDLALGHVSVHGDRRGSRLDRSRGHGLEDR